MPLFAASDRSFARNISTITFCNPFLPERIRGERVALGTDFVELAAGQAGSDPHGWHANIDRIFRRAADLAQHCRQRLAGGARISPAELELYDDLTLFVLYHQHFHPFSHLIEQAMNQSDDAKSSRSRITFYRAFAASVAQLRQIPGVELPGGQHETAPHLFACFFQIRRAFHHIYRNIAGNSPAAARLRAAAWESIFTHDLRRYRRSLFSRMGDLTTLITGPSGTGKELVARAIGLSRYIPFNPATLSFEEEFTGTFHPLSISALSPTLVESELFGHRRGAFTGALEDRPGWLEICRPQGTVFLDEVGEIDPPIQVKLLRVLQTRGFERLGDTRSRQFVGKIIAATNRDLASQMRAGRFREDLFYRLCSDMVTTPSLFELLNGSADELHGLILFIARRIAPDDAPRLTEQVDLWIATRLGRDYPWPGNFRELEQCVRNVLVRGQYHPLAPAKSQSQADSLAAAFHQGSVSADELVARYCQLIYARTGSYEATARQLKLDRRTVKAKIQSQIAETAP